VTSKIFTLTESLDHMVLQVYNFAQVDVQKKNKTTVTYITRPYPRRLEPSLEIEFLRRIKELPNVNLKVVDFAAIPFKEQINIAANTNVLIGVHGNGCTQALFLPSGATLIELFPKDCFRVEYRILTKTRKLNYFGLIPNLGFIDDLPNEYIRCFGNHDAQIDNFDIDSVISILQKCSKAHH
jgi:protein O-GlcNAc transferase